MRQVVAVEDTDAGGGEQVRQLCGAVGAQAVDHGEQRHPVRRRERLPVAVDQREGDLDLRIVEGCDDRPHEVGVQERHVGRREEDAIDSVRERRKSRAQCLEWPAIRLLVTSHERSGGQIRKPLASGGDHDYRREADARDDLDHMGEERAATPVEQCLRRPHPARPTARQDDACRALLTRRHTGGTLPPVPVEITGVAQVAITAANLDRALRFYRDALGLPLWLEVPAQRMAFVHAGDVRLYLQEADGSGGVACYLETPSVGTTVAALRAAGVEGRRRRW